MDDSFRKHGQEGRRDGVPVSLPQPGSGSATRVMETGSGPSSWGLFGETGRQGQGLLCQISEGPQRFLPGPGVGLLLLGFPYTLVFSFFRYRGSPMPDLCYRKV